MECMNRPYVICHILSSLDGKINGPFMAAEATTTLSGEYGRIRREMNADAWLYGTTTAKEFVNYREPVLEEISSVPEAAPLSYRAYLRKRGVSYILAGKTELDCKVAMEKLHCLFHIEKLLICGGGASDWTFLRAGMVDELSLVLSPVTDGSSGGANVFTRIPGGSEGDPIEFTLKAMERIGDSGLYLKYLTKNAKQAG